MKAFPSLFIASSSNGMHSIAQYAFMWPLITFFLGMVVGGVCVESSEFHQSSRVRSSTTLWPELSEDDRRTTGEAGLSWDIFTLGLPRDFCWVPILRTGSSAHRSMTTGAAEEDALRPLDDPTAGEGGDEEDEDGHLLIPFALFTFLLLAPKMLSSQLKWVREVEALLLLLRLFLSLILLPLCTPLPLLLLLLSSLIFLPLSTLRPNSASPSRG